MSVIPRSSPLLSGPAELQPGDRMTREKFHRLYEKAPAGFKAELIGGVVHVPSPLRLLHGTRHLKLGMLFAIYDGNTPGVEAGDNTTVFLSDDSEPQPDLYLRVLPECGGQSATTPDDYIVGAPELIAEIAHSSRPIDLHAKREDYAQHGVREYLVASLTERRLYWFDLPASRDLPPDPDGICRIRNFPGLWIDPAALFAGDFARLSAALQQGLGSPEHAAFVERLAAARRH